MCVHGDGGVGWGVLAIQTKDQVKRTWRQEEGVWIHMNVQEQSTHSKGNKQFMNNHEVCVQL